MEKKTMAIDFVSKNGCGCLLEVWGWVEMALEGSEAFLKQLLCTPTRM